MSIGTFDAFTAARLGIYAAQHGLSVTGNNISNINTAGYTRQRLDQVSFKAGAYDRYRSQLENHVGSGALVMNINQVRDPYLDVRFRNISADVGYDDRMLAGLQEIADILDEVGQGENASENEKGDGLLHAQIQDLATKLRAYADEPTKTNNDLVRGSAETLCSLFNKYADKLETLYQETKQDFYAEVTEINECLRNIRDLNREIRDNEIFGDNALELRDERNRQIDKLSQYMHIKVVYSEESIGGAQTVEKLSIYLDDDNPDQNVRTDESLLIDGVFGAQLQTQMPVPNPEYKEGEPDNIKYLNKENKPCGEADAAQMDIPNFGLTISKLLDIKNQEWKDVKTTYSDVDPDQLKITGDDGKMIAVGTKNAAGWTLVSEPVAAVYSFNFTPSDTAWEAGNALEIVGKKYTIVEGDADDPENLKLSAGTANKKEEMAKFIAARLGESDAYKDKYKVEAVTGDDGTVSIQFTANEAGAIPVSERPNITTKSDPAGKLKFSARLIVTAGKDAVLEPPEDVSTPTDGPGTDGKQVTVGYRMVNGVWQKKTTVTEYTREIDLDDNDLHGSIQAIRELLTGNGEFATTDYIKDIDENAAKERGIPYYQNALDLLAKEFAKQYNQINQGYAVDKDGYYLAKVTTMDKDGKPLYEALPEHKVTYYESVDGTYLGLTKPDPAKYPEGTYKEVEEVKLNLYMTDNAKAAFDDYFKALKDDEGNNAGYTSLSDYLKKNGEPMGGVLFSNRNDRDDPNDITASNIAVAHKWSTGDVELVPKYEILFGGDLAHSTQNKNADHMVNMIEKSLTYNPKDIVAEADSSVLFKGNFNDMFSRLNTTLGDDIRATNINLNTSYTQQTEIDTQRDGVSGVDLNDEAMNMMQFQKAMNAAMRLMTVIDEALDRLINNTGIAGR